MKRTRASHSLIAPLAGARALVAIVAIALTSLLAAATARLDGGPEFGVLAQGGDRGYAGQCWAWPHSHSVPIVHWAARVKMRRAGNASRS